MAAKSANSPNREQRRGTMSRCSVAMSAGPDDPGVAVNAVAVWWLQGAWRSLGEAELSATTVHVCMQLREEAPPSLEELRASQPHRRLFLLLGFFFLG